MRAGRGFAVTLFDSEDRGTMPRVTVGSEQFARLPSVERVLATDTGVALLGACARGEVVAAVRVELGGLRSRIARGDAVEDAAFAAEAVAGAASRRLGATRASAMRRVVNATGVVLHTNLGRAVLAGPAIDAALGAASAPVDLEFDLASGRRGRRDALVEEHVCALTGAEAAVAVNNNAAAVMLALNTLAFGRAVAVSRGELVEIGGSFRIPEVLEKSGARLREVGATNRTHAGDYRKALDADVAVLLKVHTSNYEIVGFTHSVALEELSAIAAEKPGTVVVEDLGAGALVDLTRWGLPPEPVVGDRLAAGADIVTFSGDKLLGGPQCGLVVGSRELVDRMRANPLLRALRLDKMTLAALEATLALYRFAPDPAAALPTLGMLARPVAALQSLADEAAVKIAAVIGDAATVDVVDSEGRIGSGSQPTVALPSRAVRLRPTDGSADRLAERFRQADPPIVGRVADGCLLLDVRAVDRADDLVPCWDGDGNDGA